VDRARLHHVQALALGHAFFDVDHHNLADHILLGDAVRYGGADISGPDNGYFLHKRGVVL
jgi:hypothetical protein